MWQETDSHFPATPSVSVFTTGCEKFAEQTFLL